MTKETQQLVAGVTGVHSAGLGQCQSEVRFHLNTDSQEGSRRMLGNGEVGAPHSFLSLA
jgi:hypothetical protein